MMANFTRTCSAITKPGNAGQLWRAGERAGSWLNAKEFPLDEEHCEDAHFWAVLPGKVRKIPAGPGVLPRSVLWGQAGS